MAVININLPASAIIGPYLEHYSDTSTPAGNVNVVFTAVPDGQVWVVEGACCWDRTTAIDALGVHKLSGATVYCVAIINPVGIHDGVYIKSPITLFPGEALQFQWRGVVLNDDTFADAVGVKYRIELF